MLKKIALFLVMSLLVAVPALAAEAPKTLVQVSGTSQKEVSPDIARISLGVQSFDKDLEKAKNDNTQTVNRVIAALKAQGVTDDEIKTEAYQVDPQYNYEEDKLPVLKGYRVIERLDVHTSIEKAGLIINEVTGAGANEIYSVRFETANEAQYKNEALTDAVDNALQKAEVIAAALHKRVGRVTLVNESGVSYLPVMLDTRLFKSAASGNAPTLAAGKVTVNANVQVTVELE